MTLLSKIFLLLITLQSYAPLNKDFETRTRCPFSVWKFVATVIGVTFVAAAIGTSLVFTQTDSSSSSSSPTGSNPTPSPSVNPDQAVYAALFSTDSRRQLEKAVSLRIVKLDPYGTIILSAVNASISDHKSCSTVSVASPQTPINATYVNGKISPLQRIFSFLGATADNKSYYNVSGAQTQMNPDIYEFNGREVQTFSGFSAVPLNGSTQIINPIFSANSLYQIGQTLFARLLSGFSSNKTISYSIFNQSVSVQGTNVTLVNVSNSSLTSRMTYVAITPQGKQVFSVASSINNTAAAANGTLYVNPQISGTKEFNITTVNQTGLTVNPVTNANATAAFVATIFFNRTNAEQNPVAFINMVQIGGENYTLIPSSISRTNFTLPNSQINISNFSWLTNSTLVGKNGIIYNASFVLSSLIQLPAVNRSSSSSATIVQAQLGGFNPNIIVVFNGTNIQAQFASNSSLASYVPSQTRIMALPGISREDSVSLTGIVAFNQTRTTDNPLNRSNFTNTTFFLIFNPNSTVRVIQPFSYNKVSKIEENNTISSLSSLFATPSNNSSLSVESAIVIQSGGRQLLAVQRTHTPSPSNEKTPSNSKSPERSSSKSNSPDLTSTKTLTTKSKFRIETMTRGTFTMSKTGTITLSLTPSNSVSFSQSLTTGSQTQSDSQTQRIVNKTQPKIYCAISLEEAWIFKNIINNGNITVLRPGTPLCFNVSNTTGISTNGTVCN